jgi:hypothetical protein
MSHSTMSIPHIHCSIPVHTNPCNNSRPHADLTPVSAQVRNRDGVRRSEAVFGVF